MIEITNLEVFNIKGAIRAMRNPMNSWDKSDSGICDNVAIDCYKNIVIGENDLALMQKLYKAGDPHYKFMRQIIVNMDINAPLYWWKEFDTYKVGTVANSCSTMHTIHKRDLTIDDFSHEHLSFRGIMALKSLISIINEFRRWFVEGGDTFSKGNKKFWWQMIQLLPSSYNQKRTVTLNYAVLANMLRWREFHKLDEWVYFCKYILNNLPYFSDIVGGRKHND